MQVVVVMFTFELGQYWMHRAMHNWTPLWLTHAPHHHITQLNAAKGYVGNPIELFLISIGINALLDVDLNVLFAAITGGVITSLLIDELGAAALLALLGALQPVVQIATQVAGVEQLGADLLHGAAILLARLADAVVKLPGKQRLRAFGLLGKPRGALHQTVEPILLAC